MDRAKATYDQAANALCHCKLEVAKSLFSEAAKLYAHTAMVDHSNIDLNKLNAAVCFYLAGAYDDAIAIIDLIRTARLDKDLQQMSSELYDAARVRRRGSFWETVAGDLKEMRDKGMHKDILRLLKENPYCLKEEEFARQMRDSCTALGLADLAGRFGRDLKEVSEYD